MKTPPSIGVVNAHTSEYITDPHVTIIYFVRCVRGQKYFLILVLWCRPWFRVRAVQSAYVVYLAYGGSWGWVCTYTDPAQHIMTAG